ncbi:hypothetical protein UB44_17130 [Burkholderiaceae bacterium 26]|uniref:hypothetical protein n=1 Tax=Ralstonia sp. Ralssp110 TaxID=3243004 RepID=UPI0005EB71A3|nr:hypothetical protein UB44_17130 [Burkholderiaceae bacterium 26]
MTKLSTAQQKIFERMLAGETLEFDPKSGRFVMQDRDKVKHVDQRPVEVMLRDGALWKDMLGRCHMR